MQKIALLQILLVICTLTSFAQKYPKEELEATRQLSKKLVGYYNNSDPQFLDHLAPRFSFDDYTAGLRIKSVEEVKQVLAMDRGVEDWKVDVEKIVVISPQLSIVYGNQTGKRKGVPFRTRFISQLVFNKERKLLHWTDTVDPTSFQGGTKPAEEDATLIKEFYKNAYSRLDPARISEYLHPQLKLRDHTLNLTYTGVDTIKYVWKTSAELFDMKRSKIELKHLNPICKDVLEAQGNFNGYRKDGKKLKSPFSSIFILKDNKIFRWIDHVDANAFR